MNILAIIPARGGSKGIPRKNVRLLEGKPLITYAIENAKNSRYNIKTIVSTDDEEIKSIALMWGADVIDRPVELADDKTTLDPVIYHAVLEAEKKYNNEFDIIITMQPTSPCLKAVTLDKALDEFIEKELDTLISGVNDSHLSWKIQGEKIVPNYKERLNRQYLPKEYRETGAFVISKRIAVTQNSRIGEKVSIFECPPNEAVDIDSVNDWCVAETELKKKKILIRLDGNQIIGMGHVYRGLQIAESFIEHNLTFVLNESSHVGIEKIKHSNFQYKLISDDKHFLKLIGEEKPDIVITDILDTSKEYIDSIKAYGPRVVSFEDCGSGTESADAVINALYDGEQNIQLKGNIFWGSDYYIIRNDFLNYSAKLFSQEVKEILVVFGGVDPANLTLKTINALNGVENIGQYHVTLILGMGYSYKDEIKDAIKKLNLNCEVLTDIKSMAEYMKKADLAISSQGRTMLELASMGVPTILMAQNSRELSHEFGEIKNGFLNLGLGSEVTCETLGSTIKWLIDCPQIRKSMHDQMLKKDLRHGMNHVKRIILGDEE